MFILSAINYIAKASVRGMKNCLLNCKSPRASQNNTTYPIWLFSRGFLSNKSLLLKTPCKIDTELRRCELDIN